MVSETKICSVLFFAALSFLGFAEDPLIGSKACSSFICNALLLYRNYMDVGVRDRVRSQLF